MKKILTIVSALLALAATSCTNLDEHIYSQMPKDDFLADPSLLALYTARPYTSLQKWGAEQSMLTMIMQLTNEVAIAASYTGNWKEPRYGELQTHDIPTNNKLVCQSWDYCFNGIAACNDALNVLKGVEQSPARDQSIAETKVIRAFYYLLATDCWGKVPYSVDKNETGYPEEKDREFILKFIEDEIAGCIDDLNEEVNTSSYGRVTKWTAKFILAKIYLNSEKWRGTKQYDKAAAICKEIMDSGKYSLATNYADNFAIHNENGKEAIFAIPYSNVYTYGEYFYIWVMTFNDDLTKAFNLGSAWNGSMICQPDFFNTYDPADTRCADTWLYGQVKDASGADYTYKVTNTDGSVSILPYILNPSPIDEIRYREGLGRLDGARIIKWPYQTDGTLNSYKVAMENDFYLMRYSDVVLMYVEALVRQNKTTEAAAVPEFQRIRQRAGLAPMTAAELTLDNLLIERQHEMAMEGWSRQDLIRFGHYTDAWWAKEADADNHTELLPIPELRRGDNPNLGQNIGY